jgi:hypothetical protein
MPTATGASGQSITFAAAAGAAAKVNVGLQQPATVRNPAAASCGAHASIALLKPLAPCR